MRQSDPFVCSNWVLRKPDGTLTLVKHEDTWASNGRVVDFLQPETTNQTQYPCIPFKFSTNPSLDLAEFAKKYGTSEKSLEVFLERYFPDLLSVSTERVGD